MVNVSSKTENKNIKERRCIKCEFQDRYEIKNEYVEKRRGESVEESYKLCNLS